MFTNAIFALILLAPVTAITEEHAVNLPFGHINVVVLTDVHSWIAGHGRHEPHYNADYGHVLSFYERLQNYTSSQSQDLFFIMNGDFMDGTGLSTAPPSHLVPLLETMPWDAVNIGNHELYLNSTVEFIAKPNGFIEFWKDSYLTSNIYHANSPEPLGRRYKVLEGSHTGVRILTFGFLYNFAEHCSVSQVQSVQETVNEPWFQQALSQQEFDAVMVMAHMDVKDPLVYTILGAIRSVCGSDMPVQFITGHTHYRGYTVLDNASTSFEAGRFLDTIGFVSFPTVATTNSTLQQFNATEDAGLFQHTFIDANVEVLGKILGMDDFTTDNGTELSKNIRRTQESMGLTATLGCSPQTFELSQGLDDPLSLWGLYLNQVLHEYYLQGDPTFVVILNFEGFRYDLFAGTITLDDLVSVSPFNDTIYTVVERIQGSTLLNVFGSSLPNYVPINNTQDYPDLSGFVVSNTQFLIKHPERYFSVLTADFNLVTVSAWVSRVTGEVVEPRVFLDSRTRQPMTTSNVWVEFIAEVWPCQDDKGWQKESTSWPLVIVVTISIAALLVFIVCSVRRRYCSTIIADYEETIAQEEKTVNYNSVV